MTWIFNDSRHFGFILTIRTKNDQTYPKVIAKTKDRRIQFNNVLNF